MRREVNIVATGNNKDADKLVLPIKKLGMHVSFLPTISIVPKKLSINSISALKHIFYYDYIFFTSVNAVTFFARALLSNKIKKPKQLPQIVAVGSITARACRVAGFPVKYTPKYFTAKDMLKTLRNIKGKKILFPRSDIAPDDVVKELRARNALVTVIPIYQTSLTHIDKITVTNLFKKNVVGITFMSSSSVENFSKSISRSMLKKKILDIPAICIGPRTARTVLKAGFQNIITAKTFTTQGIVEAIRTLL